LGTLLTPENLKLEGHFFPDTYYFWPGFDDNGLEIKNKLLATFAEKVAPLQTWYALSETEFREKLIVASLLEKEVRHLEEMRLVAGIMYNRLKRGMPLQIDATVGYGVCLPKFEKGIYCNSKSTCPKSASSESRAVALRSASMEAVSSVFAPVCNDVGTACSEASPGAFTVSTFPQK